MAGPGPAGLTPALLLVVPGMRDRQPAAHQGAQARGDLVGPIIEFTGPDRGRQLRFVGEADTGQRVGDLGGGVVE